MTRALLGWLVVLVPFTLALLALGLKAWARSRPDAGLTMHAKQIGRVQKFTGHDEALGKASAERAAIQADQRRINEARRALPVRPEAPKRSRARKIATNVVPMGPRKAGRS